VLGLFELDTVGPDIPGPYRYSILTYSGQVFEAEYHMPDAPPEKPILSEAEGPAQGTPEWKAQQEYDTWLCAVAHEDTRTRAIEEWLNNCAAYIVQNCLEPADRERLVEPEDYQAVYHAALVPKLTRDDVARALSQTFRAEFEGLPILDALWRVEPGQAKLDIVRLWEAELLNSLGLVTAEEEARYAALPVMERARKVAAFKLADWIGALEIERQRQEMAKRK
jgi:hypothetical protein